MSVIINDFEVVVQPPPQSEAAPAEPAGPPPPQPPPSPMDLEDVFERQAHRHARLRAH